MEIKDVIEYGKEFGEWLYFAGCAATAFILGIWIWLVPDVPSTPVCLVIGAGFSLLGIVKIRHAKRRLKERSGFSSIEEYEQAGAPDA